MTAAKEIRGRAYPVAHDVDTDTIIKSRWCTTTQGPELAPHCLAELRPEGHFVATGPYAVIFCRGTFGLGSARIQAPIALAAAGVRAVVAPAFAPIFFENCLNGAFLLPLRAPVDRLPEPGEDTEVRIAGGRLRVQAGRLRLQAPCTLPAWALAGKSWMQLVAEQAAAAGGLEALRRRGLQAG